MRTLLLTAMLIHVGIASKITIYETDDAPVPYIGSDQITKGPMVVIFHSSVSRGFYRAAFVPSGFKNDLIRTDPAYQDLAKLLSSDQELSGLYADITKFQNRNIFDIPLAAGDLTIVPSSFRVSKFLFPKLPLMLITYPEDMQGFEVKNTKQVGQIEI